MNPPAKSSLSPSHIKNTKNNLTIHPIKIVKSNDNTNNWQTVPIRSPSTPTSPNPIIQKTNSFSSKNRFSALATNEISYEISNEVEMLSQEISNVQPKIPPIYIKDDIDFFDFCKKIKPFTDPDGFNTKSSSSGLKLMTYSINAYRQIIKFLEINNMNFHTYQTNEEKAFRVVIRHLHHTTPTDYIKEELHSLGFITRSITNCLQYKTKNPLPLFFVDLEPSPSNHNIYKADSICYTKIKIEAPHPKKNPVQRLRCQNYGHTRTYCHHTPRCVKRCDIHLSFECQKDSNTPATCALCSGDHPASYCSNVKMDIKNIPKSPEMQDPNVVNHPHILYNLSSIIFDTLMSSIKLFKRNPWSTYEYPMDCLAIFFCAVWISCGSSRCFCSAYIVSWE
ncbi:hypothetical protein QTP88_000047 [Uroleucon formosanum]